MNEIETIKKELQKKSNYGELIDFWIMNYYNNHQFETHCTWIQIPKELYELFFEPKTQTEKLTFSHKVTEVKSNEDLQDKILKFNKTLTNSLNPKLFINSEINKIQRTINEVFDFEKNQKRVETSNLSNRHKCYYKIIRGEINKYEHKQHGLEWLYVSEVNYLEFLRLKLSEYEGSSSIVEEPIKVLNSYLENKQLDLFFQSIKAIFASIPYSIHKVRESYLHTNLHVILYLLGAEPISEDETNIGRIDSVIKLQNVIYIIEYKIGGKATEALDQIKSKRYFEKYENYDKEIILIGVAIDEKERNISDWEIEEFIKGRT